MYTENLSNGSTIKKFDYFRSQKDSMLITNDLKIRVNGLSYYINLIVEHIDKSKNIELCLNPITVSDLKRCFKIWFEDPLNGKPINEASYKELINISLPSYHFMLYFKLSLEQELLCHKLEQGDIVQLSKPITIHAQTSDDMDYEWDGNQYGDTYTFYITGYKINHIFDFSKYTTY